MKNAVLRRSSAALAALALAFVAFGVASVFADIPASAYVQNGLVAQWDGIENAGVGTHSSDIAVWKDLVGGVGVELPDWVAVEDCSLYSTASASHTAVNINWPADLSSKDSAWTVEIVQQGCGWTGSSPNYMNLQQLFNTPRGTLGYRQNNAKGFFFYGPSLTTMCSLQNWVHSSAQVVDRHTMSAVLGTSKETCSIWMDGVKDTVNYNDSYSAVNATGFSAFGNKYMNIRVFSVRIYNRALTAEEIACNANVDKVRFEGVDPWPEGYRWNAATGKVECRVCFASSDKARGSVAAEIGGSAASSPFWCIIGDSVQLTPTPASGYKFVRWVGDTDGVAVDAAGVATFPAAPHQLTAVFVPSSVDPVDRSWSGAGDGKDWFDANNWQPVGVPAEADFITIGTGKSIVLTNSTEELSSLTLASTLACSNWTTCIRAVDVKLLSGAVVKPICAFSNSDMSNRVWISATSLDIASGASINADGKGYTTKCGPCWAGISNFPSTAGGAHGGRQGISSGDNEPRVYGDVRRPLCPGSGAGGDGGLGTARCGGGAILVELSGDLTVDGSITAIGSEMWVYCGGGSGGSVCITCRTIRGSGTVSAAAGAPYMSVASGSSPGSGGRVAVAYDPVAQDEVSDCDVFFSAAGSASKGSGVRSPIVSEGGSVWFPDQRFLARRNLRVGGVPWYGDGPTEVASLDFPGDLVLDGALLEFHADDAAVSVAGDLGVTGTVSAVYGLTFKGRRSRLTVGGDVMMKGSSIRSTAGVTMDVAGNLAMPAGTLDGTACELRIGAGPTNGVDEAFGAVVSIGGDWTIGATSGYFPSADPTNGAVVRAVAGSFTLDADAVVNADGKGYRYDQGPGWNRYSGAAHGGRGGSYSSGKVGTTYGNARRPLTPGSGASDATYGVYGGGAIFVETIGDMTLNGSVSANGKNGKLYSGASAGGSVFLKCGGRLSGSPVVISADGGSCDEVKGSIYGCGGGGGRVAIWYQKLDFDPKAWNVHASGGVITKEASDTGHWGEDGSVCWRLWNQGMMILVR